MLKILSIKALLDENSISLKEKPQENRNANYSFRLYQVGENPILGNDHLG
jgi:hypothetical protein